MPRTSGRSTRSSTASAPATAARSPARSASSRIGDPLAAEIVARRLSGHRERVRRSASPARRAWGSRRSSARSSGTSARSSETVGVISVDPSSPFTAGALLGDRIRLADHFLDPDVFIRSMATRGHLGGLAEATLQAALILDAAGKDLDLRRDGRHRAERGGDHGSRRHDRARPHAGLGRRDPGAQGRDHGDSRRDRRQQARPPGGQDDGDRGALHPPDRAESATGSRRSC